MINNDLCSVIIVTCRKRILGMETISHNEKGMDGFLLKQLWKDNASEILAT